MFDLQLRSRLSSEKVRENLSSTTQPRKLLLKELQQTHMHTYILHMQTNNTYTFMSAIHSNG